jgi:hypothetical protein
VQDLLRRFARPPAISSETVVHLVSLSTHFILDAIASNGFGRLLVTIRIRTRCRFCSSCSVTRTIGLDPVMPKDGSVTARIS